jgi:hypothetical protein
METIFFLITGVLSGLSEWVTTPSTAQRLDYALTDLALELRELKGDEHARNF